MKNIREITKNECFDLAKIAANISASSYISFIDFIFTECSPVCLTGY